MARASRPPAPIARHAQEVYSSSHEADSAPKSAWHESLWRKADGVFWVDTSEKMYVVLAFLGHAFLNLLKVGNQYIEPIGVHAHLKLVSIAGELK